MDEYAIQRIPKYSTYYVYIYIYITYSFLGIYIRILILGLKANVRYYDCGYLIAVNNES